MAGKANGGSLRLVSLVKKEETIRTVRTVLAAMHLPTDPPATGYARQTLIAAGVAKQPVEMAVVKDDRESADGDRVKPHPDGA